MNIENKYFDIIINDNSFYVVECSSKPKNEDSALATLAKIEAVVKNNFEYNVDRQDEYSKLSKNDLLKVLKKKSSEIHNGYTEKQSKLNWLARKIFSKEKEVKAIHTRIENYISPPRLLPLPNEIIQEMSKYLEVSNIAILAQLNRQGKTHAVSAFVSRAREFGYEGKDNNEATEYIENLFKEVNELAQQKIIPKKYLAYKKKEIDSEKILQNLQELTTEDIFSILKNEKLYSPSFQKFRKIFNLQQRWKVTKADSDNVRHQGSAALVLAAKNGDKSILKLLLQHGADPNIPARNGSSPLHYAAQSGYADIVELLLKHGAKVNEQAGGHNTALAFACGHGDKTQHNPNPKVVELLLEHGANPNIPARNGSSPLHYAAQSGYADIVELLLKHGAKVNEQAGGHNTALAFACGHGNKTQHNPNPKVVELLLQHGANPNIPARDGSTPLKIAQKYDLLEIISLLLSHDAHL